MTSTLTDEQVLALWRWVWTDNGVSRLRPRPNWKRLLLDAWSRAGVDVAGYSPALQQIRNQFGPEWLEKQTAQSIERLSLRPRTVAAACRGAA